MDNESNFWVWYLNHTEPTYIGDNHWLRSDGTTFESKRPKPKGIK